MRTTTAISLLSVLALTACSGAEPRIGMPVAGGARATAVLQSSAGAVVGRASATEVAGGMRITIDAQGLSAGRHGAHIHTTGRCDVADFSSAGGHWNPTGMRHGAMNPQGPHGGDLPNLIVGSDGRGALGVVLPGATMAGLLDSDGAAIVIHAAADDLVTDPSGNSGGRIACGVFTPG